MFFLDSFLKGLKPQFDDDIVDRLNYYYTPMLVAARRILSDDAFVNNLFDCSWLSSHLRCRRSSMSANRFNAGCPPNSPVHSHLSIRFPIESLFAGAWEQYSENYCFVQNTYFLPLTQYIPRDFGEREDREIGTALR